VKVGAVILAAGKGTRFNGDKVWARLGGKPVWRWSFEAFLSNSRVDSVGIVGAAERLEEFRELAPEAAFVVAGGETRVESSRIAVDNCSGEAVLIHDGARPIVSQDVVDSVLDGIERTGAAAPAQALSDTVRSVRSDGFELLDRSNLRSMQTPQGARKDWLLQAYDQAGDFTDDIAMLEALGKPWEMVKGDPRSFKVTTAFDLHMLRGILGFSQTRTGFGYDVHRFSDDATRPLMVGGVEFEGFGLEGHSDADALIHAIVDAILGAASLGDIGVHFPNTDPQWKDRPSVEFLKYAARLVGERGWSIVNIDATVVAEWPRIMSQATAIRQVIAQAAGCSRDSVSIKATTNEKLGSIGRQEGLAAFAVATLREA
jgi:2-C-methyl-D-erythritol 4-phosphate cytidylyltransferase / 2-C-methyl-D-erythritol 2,4-cyclodiphosphate synthase